MPNQSLRYLLKVDFSYIPEFPRHNILKTVSNIHLDVFNLVLFGAKPIEYIKHVFSGHLEHRAILLDGFVDPRYQLFCLLASLVPRAEDEETIVVVSYEGS